MFGEPWRYLYIINNQLIIKGIPEVMWNKKPFFAPVHLFFHLIVVKKRKKNGIIFAKKPQNLK